MKRMLTGIGFFLWVGCALAQEAAPPSDTWQLPECRRIAGSASVAITTDDGATLTTSGRPLRGVDYAYGLAVLRDVPNTILLAHNRALLRSTSAGCRWTPVGEIATTSDGFPSSLAAARGDRAFAWSDRRNDLARIDGTTITYLGSPVDAIVGIATDPTDADGVRIAGGDGSFWNSSDGGSSFARIGNPLPGTPFIFYRAGFDPSNLDHAIFGVATDGAYVTFDGGGTWTRSTGLSSTGDGPVNVFSVVVSPADPATVFVMGLDVDELDAGAPSQGRHIYRSRDGGLTFAPVVDASPSITIPNQPPMAAHPTDRNVVYFTFGSSFFGYGADLYRYDDATGLVSIGHNGYHGIPAIGFHPLDPSVMYLGLAISNAGGLSRPANRQSLARASDTP